MEIKGLKENKHDEKGSWNAKKLSKNSLKPEALQRNSPRQDYSREVGLFLIQLAQASLIMPKREVA